MPRSPVNGNTIVDLLIVVFGVESNIWSFKLQPDDNLDSGIFNSWKIIHLDGIWKNIQNQIKTKCSCQILAKHDFVWKIFFQDNYRQETVYSIHQMRMNRRIHLNVYQFYCIKTILFKCKIFKKVAFANRK